MTYDEWLKAMQTLCKIPLNQTDANFQRIVPQIITYAENRIYREMEFLPTLTSTTATLNANLRETALPITVLKLRIVNVFTPVGAPTNTSTRHTLERISPEALDMFWPQASLLPAPPRYYTLIGASAAGPPQVLSYTVRMAPEPDAAYTAEFLGVIRPTPLSPANTQTYLSTVYADLFLACCMVFASGYQRDFGAQAEDPAKAMSWEGMYTNLRQGAMLEAAQVRGEGAGWSEQAAAPLASQPR
jgi:hypothetical protein